jgi:hypothetical protein
MAKRVEQLMGRASSIEKLVHFFQHMYKGPVATRSTLGYLTTRAKETSLSEESESREKGVKLNLYPPSARGAEKELNVALQSRTAPIGYSRIGNPSHKVLYHVEARSRAVDPSPAN